MSKIKKKILIVGSLRSFETYEEPLGYGFKKNKFKVFFFKIFPNYKKNVQDKVYFFLFEKLKISFFLRSFNKGLIQRVKIIKPHILFLWRSTTILPETIRKIKIMYPEIKVVIYHNDNPYSGIINYFKYRHYLKLIKISDVAAIYRPSDYTKIKKFKPKKVKLLKPYYTSYLHKPLRVKKKRDVVFIGHYTKERGKKLNLLYNNNIQFNVFGNGWQKYCSKMNWPKNIFGSGKYKSDYIKIINESKIALGFLSVKNNDVYTRRCYEIPACKTLLFAQKTKELNKILKENTEAVYWKNDYEFINKIKFLLKNKQKIKKISKSGYLKIVNNGNSEFHRAKEIISY